MNLIASHSHTKLSKVNIDFRSLANQNKYNSMINYSGSKYLEKFQTGLQNLKSSVEAVKAKVPYNFL